MGILFNMKFLETFVVIQTTLFGGTVNTIFNFSIFLEISHYFSENVNLMSTTLFIFYNNAKYELTEMNCLRGFAFLLFSVIVHVLPNYVKKSDHYCLNYFFFYLKKNLLKVVLHQVIIKCLKIQKHVSLKRDFHLRKNRKKTFCQQNI